MRFTSRLSVRSHGGAVSCSACSVSVTGADSIECILTAATSFNGFQNDPVADGCDCGRMCADMEKSVLSRSYTDIEKDHIQDFSFLFNRVSFFLDAGMPDDFTVPSLLDAIGKGASTGLLARCTSSMGAIFLFRVPVRELSRQICMEL